MENIELFPDDDLYTDIATMVEFGMATIILFATIFFVSR